MVGEWHILDNIKAIREDKALWSLFEAIVKANVSIKAVLDTKSGLALSQVTTSGRWRVHHTMLEGAFEQPGYVADARLSYFPSEFEEEIRAGRDKLVALLGAKETTK
ncbi:hypothetical protein [Microbacterium sp.]|uniref:hypothetical protein n=1 Tax=Microbacterium sp. TaxID=51671 RepID=UPI0028AD8676|nr:hypothetical protein [Microbacterium sp.]